MFNDVISKDGINVIVRSFYKNPKIISSRFIDGHRFHLVAHDLRKSPIGLHVGVLDMYTKIVIELNEYDGLVLIEQTKYAKFNNNRAAILRYPEHGFSSESEIEKRWDYMLLLYNSGWFNDKKYGHDESKKDEWNCETLAEYIISGKSVNPQGRRIAALGNIITSRSSKSS